MKTQRVILIFKESNEADVMAAISDSLATLKIEHPAVSSVDAIFRTFDDFAVLLTMSSRSSLAVSEAGVRFHGLLRAKVDRKKVRYLGEWI